ncbi:MAG: iron(III) transport system ATP-binding protein [Candidatus Eremiobacteraeota bacterium]|nr:iron(III) transport system ATP-binding protein [Candidatus Eremiobacteraeota bacterium]
MISVSGLVKRFQGRDFRKTAVQGLDFEVPEGKLFTLLGPSGCGKTTTLRMIAGLERPSEGTIRIDGRAVYDAAAGVFLPANKRPIGMVFQSYAIWPHMSVLQNVAFPLTVGSGRLPRAQVRERALRTLGLVGLADVAERPATALSGGQQQRVALARALVREPKVLLLDEPLSNLDAQLRERMRGEIRAVQQELGITAVYVTHDQSEALAISDLIMLMDRGAIVETGAPQDIYRRPRAEFTANFIGVANAFDGTVHSADANGLIVQTAQGLIRAEPQPELRAGMSVRVFIRPENVELSRKRHADEDWAGTVRFSIYQGDCWDYTVDVNGADVRVRVHKEKAGLGHGDAVHLRPDGSEAVVMPTRDGAVYTLPPAQSPAATLSRGDVVA